MVEPEQRHREEEIRNKVRTISSENKQPQEKPEERTKSKKAEDLKFVEVVKTPINIPEKQVPEEIATQLKTGRSRMLISKAKVGDQMATAS